MRVLQLYLDGKCSEGMRLALQKFFTDLNYKNPTVKVVQRTCEDPDGHKLNCKLKRVYRKYVRKLKTKYIDYS